MSVRTPGAVVEGAPLVLRERTGRKRAVTLRGRALPHRNGPAFALEQRTKKVWYTGARAATLQLFGPSLDVPTTFSGVWRDRYLEGAVEVEGFEVPETAEDLVRICEDLVRAGSELEVTWSFYCRVGVLRRFESKPDRTEDIPWQMELEWVAEGQAEAARAEAPALSLDPARITRAAEDLSDHAALSPLDTLVAYQAQLFEAIGQVEDRVSALLEDARVVVGAARVPMRVVQSVKASATSIAMLTGQIVEEAVGTAASAQQVHDDLAAVLRAEAWRRELGRFASELRARAYEGTRALEAQAEPDPFRVVVMDGTGNLRALAQRELGSADAWVELAEINGFDDAYVVPGTEVLIPARPRRVGGA